MTEAVVKSVEELTEDVRRELNAIIDPCSIAARAPAGMIDMGLIREASLLPSSEHGYCARVRISVTHPFCLMAGVFLNAVEKRLGSLPQIEQVVASIDSAVMWRPEMMAPAYRAQLAAARRNRRPEDPLTGETA